jgi:hypothetical protein
MENVENMSVQEEQNADQQDAFLDGWGDEQTAQDAPETSETAEGEDTAEEETETASETEDAQSASDGGAAETAAEAGAEAQTETTEQKADAPEKTWTLRHMDETKNVGEAEMVTLAQKGMDYDRIRAKYDESKPAMEILSIFAKQKGVSVADYVSFLRTEAKKADGLSEAEARRSIELEDREAAVTAREAEQAAERQAAEQANAAANAAAQRRKADIDEFAREYPDVARNPDAIPKEVWDAVAAGSSLTVAYAKYTAKQAREEAERTRSAAQAAQQNIKNAARSTGSMQSAGQNAGGRDPFLEGWGE